jgi:hypothetical protein
VPQTPAASTTLASPASTSAGAATTTSPTT